MCQERQVRKVTRKIFIRKKSIKKKTSFFLIKNKIISSHRLGGRGNIEKYSKGWEGLDPFSFSYEKPVKIYNLVINKGIIIINVDKKVINNNVPDYIVI